MPLYRVVKAKSRDVERRATRSVSRHDLGAPARSMCRASKANGDVMVAPFNGRFLDPYFLPEFYAGAPPILRGLRAVATQVTHDAAHQGVLYDDMPDLALGLIDAWLNGSSPSTVAAEILTTIGLNPTSVPPRGRERLSRALLALAVTVERRAAASKPAWMNGLLNFDALSPTQNRERSVYLASLSVGRCVASFVRAVCWFYVGSSKAEQFNVNVALNLESAWLYFLMVGMGADESEARVKTLFRDAARDDGAVREPARARVPRGSKRNPMGDHLGEPRRVPASPPRERRVGQEFDLAADLYASQATYTAPRLPTPPRPSRRR